eukprot:TRINITY_DN6490_c1_g4_i1.p1 TRINITY_DN6490_c1_g4~~TRINITY_DN6490_c1_g4_i1.p1  ORF type:complete len:206 (-),score=-11.84 TRINITY_DN6490_c1_g4_i1:62-679(-)
MQFMSLIKHSKKIPRKFLRVLIFIPIILNYSITYQAPKKTNDPIFANFCNHTTETVAARKNQIAKIHINKSQVKIVEIQTRKKIISYSMKTKATTPIPNLYIYYISKLLRLLPPIHSSIHTHTHMHVCIYTQSTIYGFLTNTCIRTYVQMYLFLCYFMLCYATLKSMQNITCISIYTLQNHAGKKQIKKRKRKKKGIAGRIKEGR